MEKQAVSQFRSIAMKWGLTSGLVSIAYTILLYVIDAKLMASILWTSFSLIFIIAIMVMAVKEFRKSQEGFISLSEALFTGFFTFAIGALISVLFGYVLMNYIDANLPILIKDTVQENTIAMMQKFGASEDDISKTLEKLNEKDYSVTLGKTMINFLASSAFGFVLAFIIAAIMKKNRPVFEQ